MKCTTSSLSEPACTHIHAQVYIYELRTSKPGNWFKNSVGPEMSVMLLWHLGVSNTSTGNKK